MATTTMTRDTKKKITATARLLNVNEVRDRLGGVSRASVLRLIERGLLRRARLHGLQRVLVRASDLEKLIGAR